MRRLLYRPITRRAVHALPSASEFPPWRRLDFFHHEILHTSKCEGSRARVGRLHTPHGTVETPGFVVVGTNGAVKFVDHHDADAAGMELMFSNTLHLMLHPGTETIADAGGLHTYMNRQKPLITDSGGFQIFSFAHRGEPALPGRPNEIKGARNTTRYGLTTRSEADHNATADESPPSPSSLSSGRPRVSEQGVSFRSYRDGAPILLTPESSVAAQKQIGADIIIPLDDLPSAATSDAALAASVARTHRWEARSLRAHLDDRREQAMYCVVHGGLDRQLRAQSIELLGSLPFDGFALGGSLGRDRADMLALLHDVMPMLPTSKPNHLLGIGDEASIRVGVRLGIDTFDSCFPTRLGRHGTLLTRREGPLKINHKRFRDDYTPVDPHDEDGLVATRYTRAYLHHLWKAKEPVVHGLLTLHNIKYMADLMRDLRAAIWRDEI